MTSEARPATWPALITQSRLSVDAALVDAGVDVGDELTVVAASVVGASFPAVAAECQPRPMKTTATAKSIIAPARSGRRLGSRSAFITDDLNAPREGVRVQRLR